MGTSGYLKNNNNNKLITSTISLEELLELLKQLKYSIVTIKDKNKEGFFVEITLINKKFYFLIFSDCIKPELELNIIYNNINEKINTKNRFTYFFEKQQIIFIEIFEEKILKDKNNFKYLELDNNFKKGYDYYKNQLIYYIVDNKENEKEIIQGKITKINKDKFYYSTNKDKSSTNLPICLIQNKLLVGVQNNEKKSGYFLGMFINDLEKNFLKYKCEIKKEYIYDYLKIIIKKDCKKNYDEFFNFIKNNKPNDYFTMASIFNDDYYNDCKKEFNNKFKDKSFSEIEKSCIGSILGMAIGDAIGARVEFLPLNYGFNEVKDMGNSPGGGFNLEPGQWTDDTSMGLCIADSLIEKNGEFDPRDIMMRFILWWFCGYNNAFRFDDSRDRKGSVGLGGNISGSLYKYINTNGKNEYTDYGNKKTSGNGSIMRNAAIPICYYKNKENALQFAKKQSLITHQGDEAAGCCQLMTFIILKILEFKINKIEDEKNAESNYKNNIKDILDNLEDFKCEYKSVNYLAHSAQEGNDKNRNWNWKDSNFKYSEERAKKQPGYIGSYCMDGLAMALHVLYITNNFKDAILKAVNLCGDADSLGSIVGQIGGAYYGLDSIPEEWINTLNKWDHNEIALRGYILCNLNIK